METVVSQKIGHAIAKGAQFRPMFAELYGKTTGYCKGRGGSMHIGDTQKGMLKPRKPISITKKDVNDVAWLFKQSSSMLNGQS